ncbi:DUF2325 domain-containing protein [Anaerovorax odorimutans]|uniref:DUF2325 domain-containing protein n=1 Tax=Anaerovorax odorimutans TaxID=109327 RepID=UPI000489040D|nr:DUF2325 domain-containing protein [Anaerovorax odorimutans]
MSVVIIGGNDRMERLYIDTCKNYGCKAKVFTQMKRKLMHNIGSPDLIILFTNTVAHNMVNYALGEAKRCSAKVERCHSSSLASLNNILSSYV